MKNFIKTNLVAVSSAVALLALSGTASGATETANLTVSASVAASCSISTTEMAFGAYDPAVTHIATDLDAATGKVSVTCTNGETVTLTLGQGSNADAASTDIDPIRRMISGAELLSYDLFSESTRTTEWGNTAATGLDVTGTGAAVESTVYGRVGQNQQVPVGSYSDTVVATVTF